MRETAKLVVFVMAVYGLANAIAVLKFGKYFLGTYSERKFLGKIPFLGDLFYCPPCLSFWIGMGFSWAFLSPSSEWVFVWWKAMLVDGLLASAFAYLFHLTSERLGHNLGI